MGGGISSHPGLGQHLPDAQPDLWLLLRRSQNAVPTPSVSLQLAKGRHTCWLADCGWEDRMWWEIAHQLQDGGGTRLCSLVIWHQRLWGTHRGFAAFEKPCCTPTPPRPSLGSTLWASGSARPGLGKQAPPGGEEGWDTELGALPWAWGVGSGGQFKITE